MTQLEPTINVNSAILLLNNKAIKINNRYYVDLDEVIEVVRRIEDKNAEPEKRSS